MKAHFHDGVIYCNYLSNKKGKMKGIMVAVVK